LKRIDDPSTDRQEDTMTYRIIIERDVCSGFGACADAAPRMFAVGGDGIATAPLQTVDLAGALEAARQCPMGAIAVLDENGKELQ
jgi:ferredoxin